MDNVTYDVLSDQNLHFFLFIYLNSSEKGEIMLIQSKLTHELFYILNRATFPGDLEINSDFIKINWITEEHCNFQQQLSILDLFFYR